MKPATPDSTSPDDGGAAVRRGIDDTAHQRGIDDTAHQRGIDDTALRRTVHGTSG